MTTSAEEMAELNALYEEAWNEGIWLKEFGSGPTRYMAGAGFVVDLELLERLSGKEVSTETLTLGDCIEMSAPGTGDTRIEACRDAVAVLKGTGKTHFLREKDLEVMS